jgi:nitrite reductase/ring-hydroxylating ferredoxin subunit
MADPGLTAVCESGALREGGAAVRFELIADGRAASGFVIRHGGRVYGYLNRCAHVAMELDWLPGQVFDAEGRFLICATHGAVYEPADGRCVDGPCVGRGNLQALSVVEEGGMVYWRAEGRVQAPLTSPLPLAGEPPVAAAPAHGP